MCKQQFSRNLRRGPGGGRGCLTLYIAEVFHMDDTLAARDSVDATRVGEIKHCARWIIVWV